MRDVIVLDEHSSKHSKFIEFNTHRGYETYIFASKRISQTETEAFYLAYQLASRSSLDREKHFSTLAKKLENNLIFEGMVGLFKKLEPNAEKTIERLRAMGIRTHMLSGDTQEACKRTATALKMISGTATNLVEVNFNDSQSGRAQLNKILELITKKMTVKRNLGELPYSRAQRHLSSNVDAELYLAKNMTVILSGASVEVAQSNQWIREHLKLVLEFSHTVIGYSMTCNNKGLVVQLLTGLERITLAVGDAPNDILMLKHASVGMQIHNPAVSFPFGDIGLKSLEFIDDCLNHTGRDLNNNLNLLVDTAYQHSLMLVILTLVYQAYTAFTGVPILTSGHMLFLSLVYLPANLIYLVLGSSYSPLLRSKLPQLYAEKRALNEQIHTKSFFERLLLPSALEGTILGILTVPILYDQASANGVLSNTQMLSLSICIMAVFLYTGKLLMLSLDNNLALVSSLGGFILAVFAIGAFFLSGSQLAALLSFVNSPNHIIMTLLIPVVLGSFNYIIWEFRLYPRFYPIGYFLRQHLDKKVAQPADGSQPNLEMSDRDRDSMEAKPGKGRISESPAKKTNLFDPHNVDKLLANLISTECFSSIYKNCFRSDSEVSEQVMKLLFPREVGTGAEATLSMGLAFKSRSLTKKFAVYAFDKSILMSKLTMAVVSVCFAVYLIIDAAFVRTPNWNSYFTRAIAFLLLICLYPLSYVPQFARKSGIYSVLILVLLVVGAFLYTYLMRSDYSLAGLMILAYLSTQYSIGYTQFILWCTAVVASVTLSYWMNFDSISKVLVMELSPRLSIFRVCTIFAGLLFTYVLERFHNERLIKKEFLSGASLEETNLFAKELLGLLLPKFVLEEMENPFEISTKPKVIDDGVNVSILFCDIADFDEVVRSQENSIIAMLDGIFKKFDDLCTIHGVQKIETVGKTYMAAAGLKKVDDTLLMRMHPTKRILNLAKDMMAHIQEHTSLDLKIGIHMGKPVMGVIGYHKPQFSLIGDVVNTTSRHCTTGKKGRIMVSQAAWETIEFSDPLSGKYAKEIVQTEMKGKGLVMVYQLYRPKNRFVENIERIVARQAQFASVDTIKQVRKLEKLINKVKNQKPNMLNFAEVVLQVRPMETLMKAFLKLGPIKFAGGGFGGEPSRFKDHASELQIGYTQMMEDEGSSKSPAGNRRQRDQSTAPSEGIVREDTVFHGQETIAGSVVLAADETEVVTVSDVAVGETRNDSVAQFLPIPI
jgi:class 3 adenylate cyclase/phosphoserine phosphatase